MSKNIPNALRSMKGKHKLKKMNDYIGKYTNKTYYDRYLKRIIFSEVKNAH